MSPLAFAQTAMPMGDHSAGGAEAHSGMHSMAPVDPLETSEIGESASVISPDSPATVVVQGFAFTPATVTIPQGETVQWSFQDNGTTHTVTDSTAMGLFDSGNKSVGDSFPFAFRSAGVYPYHCQIHSSMTAAVQVPIQVAPATGGNGHYVYHYLEFYAGSSGVRVRRADQAAGGSGIR